MTKINLSTLLFSLLILHPWAAAEDTVGWRGNWTGLWPNAKPPLEWHRTPKGVLADLRFQADKPGEKADGALMQDGLVRNWLMLGPYAVKDSVKDFDAAQLADEAAVQPSIGDKVGTLAWSKFALSEYDRFDLGPVDAPHADLAKATGGFKINQIVYVHAYLYSPRGGRVQTAAEHSLGLKIWLNGKVVYRNPERVVNFGNFVNLSRFELNWDATPSPKFDLELKPGWNRLLIKTASDNQERYKEHRFWLRLQDLANIPYESKNIQWMAELPSRSNATPIIVGERIFLMAEPDELLCLDKHTGKILWTAFNSYYEMLTPLERQANPAFKEKIDPLWAALKDEKDFFKRLDLRKRIQKELVAIDAKNFEMKMEGHLESHFGIVGFTTPTPVSDGKHVWVWCGNGIAACYDLEGKRRWITRLETEELGYPCSPALVDGVLAVFLHRLVGLDAATGKILWQQKRINRCLGAVLPAKLGGTPVFVAQGGVVVRPVDGHILFRERNQVMGDTGWAPPVVLGERMYIPIYGVTHVEVIDFTGVISDDWKPKRLAALSTPDGTSRRPNGGWLDRWTAGSPLVIDNRVYEVDIYSTLFVMDQEAKKTIYWKDTEMLGLFHYNSVPVAASPALLGNHIFLMDNQGTTVIVAPGPEFKQVARNRIATQLDRRWPMPAQETIAYAPPVPDGGRFYLRGERYLYCVGEK